MEQAYNERNSSYSRVAVLARMPDFHTIPEPVWLGHFSWSTTKTKERWLKGNTVVDMGFGAQTPGDVVRDYLDFYFPSRQRAYGKEADFYRTKISTPLYLRPGILVDGVYVDIKSAYFSLVNLVGWNVRYKPGSWISPGRPCYDFPLANDTRRIAKSARACLVSFGLHRKSTFWNGSKIVERNTRNNHVNYGLWHVCQDILHAIATVAVSLNAVYIHTDGYILPSGNAEVLEDYIRSWGLRTGRKGQGPTLVFGFGNFRVGNHETKRLRPFIGKPYRYVKNPDGKWLQSQLKRRIENVHKAAG